MSNWWTILRRDAPSASLIVISRDRALARASIKLARFAQAINSTRPEIASSRFNDVE
jgi:hypothetical protein